MPTGFFERQDAARRRTRYLLLLFALVIAVLTVLANALMLIAKYPGLLMGPTHGMGWEEAIRQSTGLIVGTSGGIVGSLAFFTLRMNARLRDGGRAVAMELDAGPVKANAQDAGERQLRNVVEEMALAAGVVTPGIYLMREEPGINAFAAGYTLNDAVIVVTQGALDRLSRSELQGVVAHEFSHLVNGDTRLNMRIMAVVHGLEVLAIGGAMVAAPPVRQRHRSRSSRWGDDLNAPGALALGVSMYLLGLLGVMCSKLIKAAIVRQREWLADAAAVQFTRQPEGLAGALKKIGAGRRLGSALLASRRREVSHMLFAPGLGFADYWLSLFATHPPLEDRIAELDPRFEPDDLESVREDMLERMREQAAKSQRQRAQTEEASAQAGKESLIPGDSVSDAALLATLAAAGQAGGARLQYARALMAGVPQPLNDAAHDPDSVVPLVLFLLLSGDVEIRQQQLEAVERVMGDSVRAGIVELLAHYGRIVDPRHRMPLLEIAVPALREQERASVQRLVLAVRELVRVDGGIAVHEYVLARLLQVQMQDVLQGSPRKNRRGRELYQCLNEASVLLAVFARHGHPGDNLSSRKAYEAGMDAMLVPNPPAYDVPEDWVAALTTALNALDDLDLEGKRCLVQALVTSATHAGRITVAEAELLRVVAVSLHLPMPLILPMDDVAPVDVSSGADAIL